MTVPSSGCAATTSTEADREQRYWDLEDKITRVLLEVRKEALAALDAPTSDD